MFLRSDSSRSKNLLIDVNRFLSPRASMNNNRSTQESANKFISTMRTDDRPLFVPFENERDALGNLKKNLSTRESMYSGTNDRTLRKHSTTKGSNRYRPQNLIDENVEKINFDPKTSPQFKVIDGFERQVNIIIRNKEFMKFLKVENSKQG